MSEIEGRVSLTPLMVRVGEAVKEMVAGRVRIASTESVGVAVNEREATSVSLGETVKVGEAVREIVAEVVRMALTLIVGDAVSEREATSVSCGETVSVGVAVRVIEA